MIRTHDDKPSALSRGEIEELCLLSVIPDEGCTVNELTSRLGLSLLLAEAVKEATVKLANAGWVQELDGRVTITAEGKAWAKERKGSVLDLDR